MDVMQGDKRYTYADYYKWDDGVRYELIDGVAYMMSPAPLRAHQEIIGELYMQLRQFLKGKTCKVYLSPFDVRLNADENDDIVVQPDLVVVCDISKLDKYGCKGAPDMAIEVASPSSARMDRLLKMQKYLKYGVREYWIVDPDSKTVQAFILENGNYIVNAYADTDEAPVRILDGCVINLADVFAE